MPKPIVKTTSIGQVIISQNENAQNGDKTVVIDPDDVLDTIRSLNIAAITALLLKPLPQWIPPQQPITPPEVKP